MPVLVADTTRERRRRLAKEVIAWSIVVGVTAAFLWASAAAW